MSTLRSDLKEEINILRTEVRVEFVEVRREIGGLRTEIREDIGNLRAELRDGFGEVRREIAGLRSDITQVALAVEPPPSRASEG